MTYDESQARFKASRELGKITGEPKEKRGKYLVMGTLCLDPRYSRKGFTRTFEDGTERRYMRVVKDQFGGKRRR